MKSSTGVALTLVLMITGALSLLILQISLTTKEEISRAQRLSDKATADLMLRSSEAALLFELVTRTWELPPSVDSPDFPGDLWNFRGQPFAFGNAEASIQDLSGLITMPQPGDSAVRLKDLLRAVGVDDDQSKRVIEGLSRMQSPPSSMPLQDLYELGVIGGLSPQHLRKLALSATLYPTGSFNPATATDDALASRYSGSVSQALSQLNDRGELTARQFLGIAGVETDDWTFYPGPGFKIKTRVSFGRSVAHAELTIRVDSYATVPFSYWSRRR